MKYTWCTSIGHVALLGEVFAWGQPIVRMWSRCSWATVRCVQFSRGETVATIFTDEGIYTFVKTVEPTTIVLNIILDHKRNKFSYEPHSISSFFLQLPSPWSPDPGCSCITRSATSWIRSSASIILSASYPAWINLPAVLSEIRPLTLKRRTSILQGAWRRAGHIYWSYLVTSIGPCSFMQTLAAT